MKNTDFDSFRKMTYGLSPETVTRFLASQGWTLENRIEGFKEIWSSPNGTDDREPEWVMVPLAIDYVDFHRRFSESLSTISQAFGCSAEELSHRIDSFSTDILSVHLSGRSKDDTISPTEGEQVIHSINLLLKDFACATETNQVRRRRGRPSRRVSEFMRSSVRLGHTRRGSFVITFTVLLDEPERSRPPERQAASYRDGGEDQVPFARRVMTMFAQAVDAAGDPTRRLLGHESANAPDETFRGQLAELVLNTISGFQSFNDLEGVGFSFTWGSALPAPALEPVSAFFRLDDLPGARLRAEELEAERRATLPVMHTISRREDATLLESSEMRDEEMQRVTLSGRVVSLERARNGGRVTILANGDRSPFNVRLSLSSPEYDMAVRAHLLDVPISVSGTFDDRGPNAELRNSVLNIAETEKYLRTLS
ncbi:hypothetical protein ACFY00_02390 [Kitasatospora sp. NPDC001540]|uniref:hypothetical protein n=1 Tax=Kitasatospora sp. NPDC001540 TaxID=3364014 RepID=UPI0036968192